jgi:hypothetical protein
MLPGIAGLSGLIGGSKELSYIGLTSSVSTTSSFSFAGVSLGAADAGRYVIVAFASPECGTVNSVTIGGEAASILVQITDSGNDVTACLAIAAVPTGATGTIAVACSGSGEGAGVAVWRALGLPGASAIDTDSNLTLSGLTLDAAGGGFVIAVACNKSDFTTSWSGATENFDQEVGNNVTFSGASIVTTGTSVTVTPTLSGGPATDQVLLAATF